MLSINGEAYQYTNSILKLKAVNYPMVTFFAESQCMTTIDLGSNKLKEFTAGKLPKLFKLDLSNNIISKFVTDVLPSLTYLTINQNCLTEFKLDATSFPKLEQLVLYCNQLTEFNVDQPLPSLLTLNLSSNKLSAFRVGKCLSSLQFLYLDRNPDLEIVDFVHQRKWRLKVWLSNTKVKFVDSSVLPCVQDRGDIGVREHSSGVSDVVTEAFHRDNPIASDIIGEIQQ
jgi:hypothetical protein